MSNPEMISSDPKKNKIKHKISKILFTNVRIFSVSNHCKIITIQSKTFPWICDGHIRDISWTRQLFENVKE